MQPGISLSVWLALYLSLIASIAVAEPVPFTADATVEDTGTLSISLHNTSNKPLRVTDASISMPQHPRCSGPIPSIEVLPGGEAEWRREECIGNFPAGRQVKMLSFLGARLITLSAVAPEVKPGQVIFSPKFFFPSESADQAAVFGLTFSLEWTQQSASGFFHQQWLPLIIP